MVFLGDVGGLPGVIGTLTGTQVPAGVIAQIVDIITEQQGTIDRDINQVKPVWFGGSAGGATLGTHTEKAHATLSNAILEAVASLQGTAAAMTDFDQQLTKKDEDMAAATAALVVQTEEAVGQMDGDQRTPPSAPPATAGGDGS